VEWLIGDRNTTGRRQQWLGLLLGLATLVVVVCVFPLLGKVGSRPTAAFALPGLVAAVLAAWRVTLVVEAASAVAMALYMIGEDVSTATLLSRWGIFLAVAAVAVIGSVVRDRQTQVTTELDDTKQLLQTFERGLAPRPVPPPGFRVISRYRSSERRMSISGDFLEAVTLRDGRLGVLIGDVCGHGPTQAAFGTALRAGWKSIALTEDTDPVEWLEAIENAFFADGRFDGFATICSGFFDRETGLARLVTAGHPAPLVLGPAPAPVSLPVGPPLGIGEPTRRKTCDLAWDGTPLLFYTDGLIENPRRSGAPDRWEEAGLLRWIVEHGPATATDTFLDTLVAAATTGREPRDDVAVMIVAAT
jgi:hypothetical protein